MNRLPLPISQHKRDIVFVAFFVVNLLFVTYIIDIEQNIIADPSHFTYPIWPLPFMVDLIHWWGRTFDPVLMARPMWWRMTIWIDTIFFGPFYVAAIYAYIKGREWIRLPSIIYASVMLTNVTIILGEEIGGEYPSPRLPVVLLANAPWVIVPLLLLLRMGSDEHPFARSPEEV